MVTREKSRKRRIDHNASGVDTAVRNAESASRKEQLRVADIDKAPPAILMKARAVGKGQNGT
jgi:hypothetical protein